MAQRMSAADVRQMVFEETKARVWRYDWDTWTDGSWWLLRQGEDYMGARESVRSAAMQYARRNGMLVETRSVQSGLLVRFVPPSDEA